MLLNLSTAGSIKLVLSIVTINDILPMAAARDLKATNQMARQIVIVTINDILPMAAARDLKATNQMARQICSVCPKGQ